jgi:hypothetical protein
MDSPSLKVIQYVHFIHLKDFHPHPTLFLNNSTLFVPSVKFLGLLLDSKLPWELLLQWLCIRCERSLNISKVLSGRSWDGDLTVMLQFYCSMVCYKVDYGSFMYGSSIESKLSAMNPRIHFATGCLLYLLSWETLDRIWRTSTLLAKEYSPLWLCCEVGDSAPITPHMVQYFTPPSPTAVN